MAAPQRTPNTPRIAGVTIDGLLGVGGYAAAYLARLPGGRGAAIKVAHSPSRAAAARLSRERAALEALAGEGAPAVLGEGDTEDGRPYLALERVGGATLATHLEDRSAPPPAGEAAAWASAIAKAVSSVHRRGIAHGDLSPENVLIAGDGKVPRAWLIDFGAAHGAPGAPAPPRGAGTPEYTAPEILRGGSPSPASDIYALGAILFEILCLRPPFVGDAAALAHAHLTLAPPSPSELSPAPFRADEILAQCLAKSPSSRPADPDAIGRELAAACRQPAGGFQRPAAPPAPRHDDSDGGADIAYAVLAAVVTEAPAPEVAAAAKRARGVVLRHTRGVYVCGLLSEDERRPGRAGVALARALEELPGAVALHLAPLYARERQGRPPLVVGEAVDEPESWLPTGRWSELLVTDAFARTQPAADLSPSAHPGLFTLRAAAEPSPPALVGRAGALGAALASFRDCIEAFSPALLLAEGAPGAGRSRLLDEAVALASAERPDLRVVRFSASSPEASAAQALDRAQREPVVLLADDLDAASAGALDALSRAALDRRGARLWIAGALSKETSARRPVFGTTARRCDRVYLEPLAPDEAAALAAEFLKPAEYVPAAALREIAAWAGGLPGALEEIARALKREGVVRRRARGESFRLDTDRLAEHTSVPSAPWLATRALRALSPELAALARRAATLAPVTPDEVDAVQRAFASRAQPVADAAAGLASLVERGLFVFQGGLYDVSTAPLRAGLEALLDTGERDRVCRAALEMWRARAETGPLSHRGLEALARHAGAAEEHETAARALLTLAKEQASAFRYLDADRHFSASLDHADAGELGLVAYLGRGRIRYLIDRAADALQDLEQAKNLARELGDARAEAEALLEEATALDWASDWAASARRCEEAEALADDLSDPALESKLLAARGRTAWRRGRAAEAADILAHAADAAAAAGDYDSRVIALLLLPLALATSGDLDRASARLDEVIDLCARAGDKLHLAAAYGNRTILWSAKGAPPENSRADLRRARAIARELGHPGPERAPTFNLAEDLFWAGEDDEALDLAERARAIARRLWPKPVAEDALLVARIAAVRGDAERARAELDWIQSEVPPAERSPAVTILMRGVELLLRRGRAPAWDDLEGRAEAALSADEQLEILYIRILAARAAGRAAEADDACARARARLAAAPIWARRISALEATAGDETDLHPR